MAAILEYLKLIPKFFQNSEQIIEGIINDVKLKNGTLPENEQEEIIRRRVICASCPFMSENAKNNPSLNYKSDRTDPHCSLCQCNIDYKTACLECNCGIEVHNMQHRDQMMEIKWLRIK